MIAVLSFLLGIVVGAVMLCALIWHVVRDAPGMRP